MPLGEKKISMGTATIHDKEVEILIFLKIWSNSEYFWDQNVVENAFLHRLASRRGPELATALSYEGGKF